MNNPSRPSRTGEESSPLLRNNSDNHATPHAHYHPTTALSTRIAAAMFSFITTGLFVSSIGVMLPRISTHYALSDLSVSLIFLVGPIGYIAAASSNAAIHTRFGQRGIACAAPVLHLMSSVVLACHPPFPILLLAFAGVGLGSAWLDGSWCAWAGAMGNANTVSGLLHGSFSAGAAVGPVVAGLMLEVGRGNGAGEGKWYSWFWVLAAMSALELIILPTAFRHETAQRYHAQNAQHHNPNKPPPPPSTTPQSPSLSPPPPPPPTSPRTKDLLAHPVIPLSSLYFLAYVGTETAISGWIVSFMSRSRQASPYLSSLSSSGFWAGQAAGRLALGVVSDNLGVRRANVLYLVIAITVQLVLAVCTNIPPTIAVGMIAIVGFAMGPLYPGGIVLLTQLLPRRLHVAAVSFVGSLGQVGAAVLPFGIGALVQGVGIGVFMYVIVALLGLTMMLWGVFVRVRGIKAGEVGDGDEGGDEEDR